MSDSAQDRRAPVVPAADEARRLLALHDLDLLDTPAEERFDRITRVAAALLDVPRSLVSLVDADRQFWKSDHGGDPSVRETARDLSFCTHAVDADLPIVVEDATDDPRFATNPLVTEDGGIRFYAGVPVHARDGSAVGTLCVIDAAPRRFPPDQLALLSELARWAELELTVGRERDELQRMQRRFLAAVAHELRTPLTALQGSVEELKDPDTDEDDRVHATGAVERATARLADLVEDVLATARPEDDPVPLARGPVDVARLVSEVVDADLRLAGRVTVDGGSGAAIASVDARRVRAAVRALLRDAIGPVQGEAGTVPVTVTADDAGVTVTVAAEVPLAGLGLAVARAVAAVHGGGLGVEIAAGTAPSVRISLPSLPPSGA